jgi:hypothetical protein
MAIIVTPKGWAIEFEPASAHKKPTAKDMADEYSAVIKSLLNTLQVAQSCNETPETPDYYSFLLLENMLPDFVNAKAMFEDLLRK